MLIIIVVALEPFPGGIVRSSGVGFVVGFALIGAA